MVAMPSGVTTRVCLARVILVSCHLRLHLVDLIVGTRYPTVNMDDTEAYGLIDIARALAEHPSDHDEVLRVRRKLAQWRRRGKLPAPDLIVSGRPGWHPATIEPW